MAKVSLVKRIFGPISSGFRRFAFVQGKYIYRYPWAFALAGAVLAGLCGLGILSAPPKQSDTLAWVPKDSPLLMDFGFSSMFFDMLNTAVGIDILSEASRVKGATKANGLLTVDAFNHLFDVFEYVHNYETDIEYYHCTAADCKEHSESTTTMSLSTTSLSFSGNAGFEAVSPAVTYSPINANLNTYAESILCVFDYDRTKLPATDAELLTEINDKITANTADHDYFCDPIALLLDPKFDDATHKVLSAPVITQRVYVQTPSNWRVDAQTPTSNYLAAIQPDRVWHDSLMHALGYYEHTWSAAALFEDYQNALDDELSLDDIKTALGKADPDKAMQELVGGKSLGGAKKTKHQMPVPSCRTKDGRFYSKGTTITSWNSHLENLDHVFSTDLIGLAYGVAIAVVFSMIALSKFTRAAPFLHTRFMLLLGGLLSTLMAIGASYGLLGAAGQPTSTVSIITPCLCVALALNDIFVYTQTIGDAFDDRRATLRSAGVKCEPNNRYYTSRLLKRDSNSLISKSSVGWIDEADAKKAAKAAAKKAKKAKTAVPAPTAEAAAAAAMRTSGEYIDLGQYSPEHVFASSYAAATTAILMTKATSFMSFLVSAISDLPAITSFGLHTFFGLMVLIFAMSWTFAAFVRWDQLRIEQGRCDVLFLRYRKDRDAATRLHQCASREAGATDLETLKAGYICDESASVAAPAAEQKVADADADAAVELAPAANEHDATASVPSDAENCGESSESELLSIPGAVSPAAEPAAEPELEPELAPASLSASSSGAGVASDEMHPENLEHPRFGFSLRWRKAAHINELVSLDWLFTQASRLIVSRAGIIFWLVLAVVLLAAGTPIIITQIGVGTPYDQLQARGTAPRELARVEKDTPELLCDLTFGIPTTFALQQLLLDPKASTGLGDDLVPLTDENFTMERLFTAAAVHTATVQAEENFFDGLTGDLRTTCAIADPATASPVGKYLVGVAAGRAAGQPFARVAAELLDEMRAKHAHVCDAAFAAGCLTGSGAACVSSAIEDGPVAGSPVDLIGLDGFMKIIATAPFSRVPDFRHGLLKSLSNMAKLNVWPALPDMPLPKGEKGLPMADRHTSPYMAINSPYFREMDNWIGGIYEKIGCDLTAPGPECIFDSSDEDTQINTIAGALVSPADGIMLDSANYIQWQNMMLSPAEINGNPQPVVVLLGRVPIRLSQEITADEVHAVRDAIPEKLANQSMTSNFVMDRTAKTFFFSETDSVIVPSAIQGIALSAVAVFVVNILMLASISAALVAVAGTFLVNVCVLILMTALGYPLESMSATTLVLGSGLSIDMIVHLAHSVELRAAAVLAKREEEIAAAQNPVSDESTSSSAAEEREVTAPALTPARSRRQYLIDKRLASRYVPDSPEYIAAAALATLGPALFCGWLTTILVVFAVGTAKMTIIHIFYRQLVLILCMAALHGYFTTSAALTGLTKLKFRRWERAHGEPVCPGRSLLKNTN